MKGDNSTILTGLFTAWMFGNVVFLGPVILLIWLFYG